MSRLIAALVLGAFSLSASAAMVTFTDRSLTFTIDDASNPLLPLVKFDGFEVSTSALDDSGTTSAGQIRRLNIAFAANVEAVTFTVDDTDWLGFDVDRFGIASVGGALPVTSVILNGSYSWTATVDGSDDPDFEGSGNWSNTSSLVGQIPPINVFDYPDMATLVEDVTFSDRFEIARDGIGIGAIVLEAGWGTTHLGDTRWDVVAESVIPIPAAVWLFGSALGLLGWLKRSNA